MALLSVIVNGTGVETSARNLAELIEKEHRGKGKVATALNGQFVPVRARASAELCPGDVIEILSARQGG